MSGKVLDIHLFGACAVASARPGGFVILGAKHKALFALLATAPFGRRTRAFLQEALWGQACYDSGRQSLRRALSDIKAIMGEDYGEALSSTNAELTLNLARVRFLGGPGVGEFLEGLDIREAGYAAWRDAIRGNPAQLAGLYNLASESPEQTVLPVVAVIPFRAVGGGMADVALGDWLAEEVCRSLSRSRLMAIISHLSSRQLAKTVIELSSVRDVLKADFCVWGSLRHCGDMVVIDADFVDARTGRIVWTRQFEGAPKDILAQNSEGVSGIVSSVGAAIADEALAHVRSRTLAEIDDHRLLMAGVALMHRPSLRDFARSRELIEEALRRAPAAAETHAWKAKWHVLSVINRWSSSPEQDTAAASDSISRALDLSPDDTFGLTIDGFIECQLRRNVDVARSRYEKALSRNPNEALAWLMKSAMHTFTFEAKEAVAAAEKARRRSPIDPFGQYYDSLSAGAYLTNGEFARALDLANRALAVNHRHLSTLRVKIVALAQLGRLEEARGAVAEMLSRDRAFTVADYMRRHPCADFPMGKLVETSLRAAGAP